jgi:hypothetical protein
MIQKLDRMYKQMGKAVSDYNALQCDRCGWSELLTKEDAARYFAEGWPVCCGETMKLSAGKAE